MSLWTSINNLLIILKDPLLSMDIKTLSGTVYKSMTQVPKDLIDGWVLAYPSKWNTIRRLSLVRDVDGKTRVVAMLDYWTQWALKPYHDRIMRLLRRIPMDVTFGQDISPFGDTAHSYHSIDLTNATDRFPISLQKEVFGLLFGSDLAVAWESVLVDRSFTFDNAEYLYKAGQPMGAYSSWSTFALSHHILVQYAAIRAGYTGTFRAYRLLGDDIVIRHDEVARNYLELLGKLGVEVSAAKT